MKCRLLFTYLELELRSTNVKILEKISLRYRQLRLFD